VKFSGLDPSRRGTVYSYDDDLKTNPYLTNNPTPTTVTPPLPGANSFTESQARDRIEANGYTAVTGLKKYEQSIWRGTATKGGKPITIALDYKGNVVARSCSCAGALARPREGTRALLRSGIILQSLRGQHGDPNDYQPV
jgi:hypothetical protein